MIRGITFDFVAQSHEDAHLTVPIDVREALKLGPSDSIHLDLLTASGRAVGDFEMGSGGEIDVPKSLKHKRNVALVGIVHAGEWGVATASRVSDGR